MEVKEHACIVDDRFELATELEKSIVENFRDPVCLGIVNVLNEAKKPAECINCKQIYCYDCAHDLQNKKKTCPLCRHNFEIGPMNHKLLSILLDIECKCQYFRQGCSHRAPLKLLLSHQKECEYKGRPELPYNPNQLNRKSSIGEKESKVIEDLATTIEDIPLDDATFNEIVAAGAFDEKGNIDFTKVQKILLSKERMAHKTKPKPHYVPEQYEQVRKGNERAFSKGNRLEPEHDASGNRAISVIANFIGNLFAGKDSQDKREESKSNMPVQSQPNPMYPRIGMATQYQYPQAQGMGSHNSGYIASNYVPLDNRYRCPSGHSVGLVANLSLLPFTSNQNYQKNMFYCRQCQQTLPVGPAGVVHCLSCPFDICSDCFRIPLTCKNNHLLQKTKDLSKAPLHYRSNEATCNICEVKILPANAGILVCTNCFYHVCLDCARPPVVCPNFHLLRREINLNLFPNKKFKCSDCKKKKDFIEKSIGVLMCSQCSYYRCEDCFINNRQHMKFYCSKHHLLRRLFKFKHPGLLSWQMLNRYNCHGCKELKVLDGKGVWNCKGCNLHICPNCIKRA